MLAFLLLNCGDFDDLPALTATPPSVDRGVETIVQIRCADPLEAEESDQVSVEITEPGPDIDGDVVGSSFEGEVENVILGTELVDDRTLELRVRFATHAATGDFHVLVWRNYNAAHNQHGSCTDSALAKGLLTVR